MKLNIKLNVIEDKNGTLTVLDLVGRIDGITSPELDKQLHGILDRSPKLLILDFSRVDFINSAGVKILALTAKRTRSSGVRFALCSLQENIHSLFEMTGILQHFTIYPDRATALASLG